MNDEVKEIIVDLMTRLWKNESMFFETAADRYIFEAEMTEIYDKLEGLFEEFKERVRELCS